MTEKQFNPPLDITQIREILPHRYPFLLIDRVLEFNEEEQYMIGYKNVTANEPFFPGHFPQESVMPGVLIMEAMAQLGAVYILSRPENRGKIAYLMGIEEAKFRRPVVPGDRLDIRLETIKFKKSFGKMKGIATVEGKKAAEAIISFALGSE